MAKDTRRDLTPEQQADLKKLAADLTLARNRIDHANAVRDGQVAPKGAKQLIAPQRPEPKEGPQFRRAEAGLREAYPPDGHPPRDLSLQKIYFEVAKLYVRWKEEPPSRDVVRRVLIKQGDR